MKIFLLDDDKRSIAQMEAYIQEYAEKMSVSMQSQGFSDPEAFLKACEENEEKPYLVILQVEMEKMSGIVATESHTIQVRAEHRKVSIHTSDILYAESIGHNVWIYTKEGAYKTSLTMTKLTKALQEERSFLGCGRSYLVNMAYISHMENEVIVMSEKSRIPIPVRLRKNVAEKYREYCSG